MPSLLSQDAIELYAHSIYNLLTLMLKCNINTVDWTDEVLAAPALTNDGKMCNAPLEKRPAKPVTLTAKVA